MDVDAPNILKRCSSAPLINEAPATGLPSPTTPSAPRNSFFSMFSSNPSRTRRFSGSYSPLTPPGTATVSWGPRMAPRVSQLRLEECADASSREAAHERELHCAMQMGQSCEELHLVASHETNNTPRFSPVVSPSPTRKYTTRRSLSPIQIRASSFSPVARGKRRGDEPAEPAKRRCDRATPPTPDHCTFRPVSPRSPGASPHHNHKTPEPS